MCQLVLLFLMNITLMDFLDTNNKNHFWVKTISLLILTASIMGLMTGISLYYAPDEYSGSEEIKIYLQAGKM